MLTTLLLLGATAFAQEPKTAEDRLKELEEKITTLEKRQKTLTEENASLEKKAADARAARENYIKQSGVNWIKAYGAPLELSEKQSAELQELWQGWTKEDLEKPYDPARWKAREESLRGKLTPEQAARLGRRVREDQEKSARQSIAMLVQTAKLPAGRGQDVEKIVMAKVTFPDNVLLSQAQAPKDNPWYRVLAAAEESLPEITPALSAEEQARLRDTLARWKPRK